ncbi:MAG: hypothetical protein LBI18_11850 [Planctomycetaceae bacterium]|jgi:hypothetical protein|nr:hypothetical protein [Planctomycetaceae bacterium]
MSKLIITFFFVIGIVVYSGCHQESRPVDFPKLYPCQIKVTQNNIPVSDVSVAFYDPKVTDRWVVFGQTDQNGKATIRTHGNFVGVPAGNYKIILTKIEKDGQGWDHPDSPTRKWVEDIKVYSLIDEKYTKQETTPLELVIEKKGVTQTFEIGQPVHILRETINQNNLR